MSSNDKRKDGDGADGIEDAVAVSETGQGPQREADAGRDRNPGDGAAWMDRGDVAVDKAADAEASGAGAAGSEAGAGEDPADLGEAGPVGAADSVTPEAGEGPPPDLHGEAEPEAVASAAPPPQQVVQKSRGGFMPALLGGLVAGGVGFGAAYLIDPTLLDQGPDPVETALQQQQQQLGALESRIGEVAGTVDTRIGTIDERLGQIAEVLAQPAEDPAGARIDALAGSLEALQSSVEEISAGVTQVSDSLVTLDERIAAVERRPLVESSEAAQAAFDAYERDLAELRGALDQQSGANAALVEEAEAARAEAEQRIAEVEAELAERRAELEAEYAERQAAIQSEATEVQEQALSAAEDAAVREALAKLDVALESGTPFEGVLSALPEGFEVPEALTTHASDGVPSLPALRESFPDMAREALDASIRETVADDPTGRLVAFLRSQTGARSLAPREGDDPDAILSRAEAALTDGDLAQVLEELQALPPAGQAELADWMARAEARLAVLDARETLVSALQGE